MKPVPEILDSIPVAKPPRRSTYAELCSESPQRSTQPCELWDGELIMTPAPLFRHQKIVYTFHRLLDDFVSARQLGEVVSAPIDVVLSPHRVVQPDVAFIAKERLGIIQGAIMGAPDLVAEVISLGGHIRDRIEKKDLYEQYGVKEYWIIDPEPCTVDVHFLDSSHYELVMRAGDQQTASSRLLSGFQVPLTELFTGLDTPASES
jgi:Uma2 family endonuclease